jgi:AcrR family transcriptional regulator
VVADPNRRNRGVAAGLTRDLVVEAATRVADRKGFEGTTLRAVAAELGVSHMAVYHHVASKDELLDAVADAYVRRVLDHVDGPGEPLAVVRDLADALREAALAHPGLMTSVVGHIPVRTPSAQMDFADRVLSCLLEAGADASAAEDAYRSITYLCLGASVASHNLDVVRSLSLDERLAHHVTAYDGRPVAAYLDATRPSRETFARQLETILAGCLASAGGRAGGGS